MRNPPETIAQYQSAAEGAVVFDRRDRGLIEITGDDRASWLHNLVTNAVKTLAPGEGNYAFAINLQGRVLFDANVLVLSDRIWLDVDARRTAAAIKHLDRYLITEKVTLTDRSLDFARLAIIGPRSLDVLKSAGWSMPATMSQLQHVDAPSIAGHARLVRHDFTGLPSWELLLPSSAFLSTATALRDATRSIFPAAAAIDISPDAVRVLRMEAGIPASVDDIDEDVIPPETGQIERGISYHKGCYLGQEVIERMRAHGVLAKRLVGLRIQGEDPPPRGAQIRPAANMAAGPIGRITSTCWSEALSGLLSFGYIKSAHMKPGTSLVVSIEEFERAAEVISLPL